LRASTSIGNARPSASNSALWVLDQHRRTMRRFLPQLQYLETAVAQTLLGWLGRGQEAGLRVGGPGCWIVEFAADAL